MLEIAAESDADEKLMADLSELLELIFRIWNRDQLSQALSALKAAYRRGDVQHEQIRRILASPHPKQHRIGRRI